MSYSFFEKQNSAINLLELTINCRVRIYSLCGARKTKLVYNRTKTDTGKLVKWVSMRIDE